MKYGFYAAFVAVVSTQIEGWFSIVLIVASLVLMVVCGYRLDKLNEDNRCKKDSETDIR